MIRLISFILPVAVFLIHTSVNNSKYKPNLKCGVLIKSSCADDKTTDWNKKSIGHSLKSWIQSIRKVDTLTKQESYKSFLPKFLATFKDHQKFEHVQSIANINCDRNTATGPIWKKPSIFSYKQFYDGFLYGVENEAGEMTGKSISFRFYYLPTNIIDKVLLS